MLLTSYYLPLTTCDRYYFIEMVLFNELHDQTVYIDRPQAYTLTLTLTLTAHRSPLTAHLSPFTLTLTLTITYPYP